MLKGVRELLTVLRGVSVMGGVDCIGRCQGVVDCIERCQCDESCYCVERCQGVVDCIERCQCDESC